MASVSHIILQSRISPFYSTSPSKLGLLELAGKKNRAAFITGRMNPLQGFISILSQRPLFSVVLPREGRRGSSLISQWLQVLLLASSTFSSSLCSGAQHFGIYISAPLHPHLHPLHQTVCISKTGWLTLHSKAYQRAQPSQASSESVSNFVCVCVCKLGIRELINTWLIGIMRPTLQDPSQE